MGGPAGTGERACGQCGRVVQKCHRIYKGTCLCNTCYARDFKPRPCPRCGDVARLPRKDPEAICRSCQGDHPCVRCGKTNFKVDRWTPYGPACKVCAKYFREPEPCEGCGEPSRRLRQISRKNREFRLCDRCARADFGSCQACRRHRSLRESPDGRLLCQTCLEEGEIPCPSCGQAMPAGKGSQCEHCYRKELLAKRIRMNRGGLETHLMGRCFGEFGEWLADEVGTHKASVTINQYLAFFQEIEARWRKIPDYRALLKAFGAAYLRRHLLPMRWMEKSGLVTVDEILKREDSERRRIANLLGYFPKGTKEREIIEAYYRRLAARWYARETSARSLRLALRPAADLLDMGRYMGQVPPDQRAFEEFLRKKPGQRAALSGFMSYLREAYGIILSSPKLEGGDRRQKRKDALEKELLDIMDNNEGLEHKWRAWVAVGLAYFHGLPKKVGRTIGKGRISFNADGSFTINWKGELYWVPGFK